MKKLVFASVVAGQFLISGQTASAASFDPSVLATAHGSTFAGARLRVSLGGERMAKARLALTLAPMLRSQASDGTFRLRFGEGVSVGFSGGERGATLSFGGKPLSALTAARTRVGRKGAAGISTVGVVAIGVGVAVVGGLLIFADALNDASD